MHPRAKGPGIDAPGPPAVHVSHGLAEPHPVRSRAPRGGQGPDRKYVDAVPLPGMNRQRWLLPVAR